MKKTLLLLLMACTFSFANAQLIQLTDTAGNDLSGDTLVFWNALDTTTFQSDYYYGNTVLVTNTSPSDTMLIDLIRTEMEIIPGTGDYYCWGSLCFGEQTAGVLPVWKAGDPVKTAPGATAGGIGFSVYFAHKNNKVGSAKYKYEFVDDNNALNKNAFYIRFSISYLTSVDEKALNSSFSIFPNPAEENTTVKFDGSLLKGNSQVRIYNLLGEEVLTQTLRAGQESILVSTSELSSGIYFVNLVNNGKMLASKKLTVK